MVDETGRVTCLYCGSEVDISYRSCPVCGAPLPIPRYEPVPMSFCPRCGSANNASSSYCMQCGSFLGPSPPPPPYAAPRAKRGNGLVIAAVLAVVAVLILSALLVNSLNNSGNTAMGSGDITYRWDYGGDYFTLRTDIPLELYLEYERDSIRRYALDIDDAVELSKTYTTSSEPIIVNISTALSHKALELGLNDEATVNFVLSFVQSIPYVEDQLSVDEDEYWRYPVETLFDKKGDCEDKSFLFASIMEAMGMDSVILIFDTHAAVGVVCPGATGSYYNYDGHRYYYCETTGVGWSVGDIPEEYGSAYISQVE